MEKDRIWIGWVNTEAGGTEKRLETQRRLSALGRGLLYRMVLEEYGVDLFSEQDPFAREPLGKPYLRAHPDIFFNISHSRTWSACGVGTVPLGLDIQYHKTAPPARLDRMAERFLGRQELECYRNAGDKLSCFYHFWTKKESFLKYTGEGIRRDLGSLAYEGCQFFSFVIASGCSGMLCVPESWEGQMDITQFHEHNLNLSTYISLKR